MAAGATSAGHFACTGTELVHTPGCPRGSTFMMPMRARLQLAAFGLVFLAVACGSNPKLQKPAVAAKVPAAVTPAPVPAPPPDPIATLIASSQAHFAEGE